MLAAILSAILLTISQANPPAPIVVDEVDLIAVAHLPNGGRLATFFGRVQGQPTILTRHWICGDEAVFLDRGQWAFSFHGNPDECDRLVRAPAYIESWERADPFEDDGRPWFVQLTECGLSPPKQAN